MIKRLIKHIKLSLGEPPRVIDVSTPRLNPQWEVWRDTNIKTQIERDRATIAALKEVEKFRKGGL